MQPARLRLSFARNAGPLAAKPHGAPSLVAPDAALIREEAIKKLRLKKKEAAVARFFLWSKDSRAGTELPPNGNMASLLHNDDLIAVSLGETYQGPLSKQHQPSATLHDAADAAEPTLTEALPPRIGGSDDQGRVYSCLEELWADQAANRSAYYTANQTFWETDGYGGANDEEAMIGDDGSEEDTLHSLRFVDELRGRVPELQLRAALDVGAGVGRVTKHVLLRRCERVCLVEGDSRWLRQARRYLGNKRQQRCSFVHARCEEYVPGVADRHDLVWVQWTLQYLVDADVVSTLRALAHRALTSTGVLVIKENRPCPHTGSGATSEDAFRVDLPSGLHRRYDVTRPDAHHRWLFQCAGLAVEYSEHCLKGEVTTWALRPSRGSDLPQRALVHVTRVEAVPIPPYTQTSSRESTATNTVPIGSESCQRLLQPSLDLNAQTASAPECPPGAPLGLASHTRIGDAYQARIPSFGEASLERDDTLVCIPEPSAQQQLGWDGAGARAAAQEEANAPIGQGQDDIEQQDQERMQERVRLELERVTVTGTTVVGQAAMLS